MIHVMYFTFNPFQENTYVLYDDTKEAVIVDPGCFTQQEFDFLVDSIESEGLKPVRLVNTHCHLDHVGGNSYVMKHYNLKLEAHDLDLPTLHQAPLSAQMYGIHNFIASPEPDVFISEKDTIRFGESELEIRFVPGHAPGHVVFYAREEGFVIAGDTLFQQSIGRTDLPGGNHELLLSSIEQQLFTLPDSTVVYCGHGPSTEIGFEKNNNPFFTGR